MTVLVTGASGFVGSHLVAHLAGTDFDAVAVSRRPIELPAGVRLRLTELDDLGPVDFEGVSAVVNLVGLAHSRKGNHQDHRHVNTDAVIDLARKAQDAGVRTFVHMSSSKVYGDCSDEVSPSSALRPVGAYAQAKAAADEALAALASDSRGSGSMGIVSLQPPVIYGPGVKGNLAVIAAATRKGRPFPISSRPNRRSLLSIRSLCDAIEAVLHQPAAGATQFTLADASPVSTEDIVRNIAAGMGHEPRVLRVPHRLLVSAGSAERALGLPERTAPLTHDFVVSSEDFRVAYQWQPETDTGAGLRRIGSPELAEVNR